jgi:hypothetical protein
MSFKQNGRTRQDRASFRRAEPSVYAIPRCHVTKKQPHRPAAAPRERTIPRTPKGTPAAQARVPQPTRAPKERGIGKTPNAQKPKLVRDVHGNELKDLFQLFPDLQRVPRRAARVPKRVPRRR